MQILDKIKGKNIKLKETYDLGETNVLEDDILTVVDYNPDYKKDGRYVLINISSSITLLHLTRPISPFLSLFTNSHSFLP